MAKPRSKSLIGLLALTLIATALVNMPPSTDCAEKPPVSDHQHWFRATEIVVQPWRGEHHVYGIFTLPVQYRRHRLYSAKLIIHGLVEDLQESSPEAGIGYRKPIDSGHYVMQVHLPTRMALWFLITGRFGDLKSSCHWWLIIADR